MAENDIDALLNDGDNNLSSEDELNEIYGTGKRFAGADNIFDDLAAFNGLPPLKALSTSTYYGINMTGSMTVPNPQRDQTGLVFFTRPRLNLSYDNTVNDRILGTLVNTDKRSVESIVRSYLDPVGHAGRPGRQQMDYWGSDIVDPKNPFITCMTNLCQTLSGWPDQITDTYKTKPGLYKEEHIQYDSFADNYSSYSLSGTFYNPVGKPISYMSRIWQRYGALVKIGDVDPYPEHLFENEMDYNTRIYRLTLDLTRTYITGIAACGAAIPTTNNAGTQFDYNAEDIATDGQFTTNITFECVGAMYNDPILMVEFNEVVTMFNPLMADNTRKTHYVKLSLRERMFLNFKAYPRINIKNSELEWWCSKTDYANYTKIGKAYGYNN